MKPLITLAVILAIGFISTSIAENIGIRPTLSPDGKRLLYSSAKYGNRDIVIRNLESGKLTNLTHSPEMEKWPAFCDDPDWVLYTIDVKTSGTIWLHRIPDRYCKPLTKGSYLDINATQLPGTEWILFCRAHLHRPYSFGGMIWQNWEICCISTNGGNVTKLTTERFRQIDSISIVSSNSIVFSAEPFQRPENSSAYKLALSLTTNGLDPKQLTLIKEFGKWPLNGAVWNPVSEKMYFVSSKDYSGQQFYDYDIYSMKLDGSDVQRHTALGAICWNLSVSSADGIVLFTTDKQRNNVLTLMQFDSRTKRYSEVLSHLW